MSITVVAAVLKRKLGSTARKMVAIKLADVAGDDGDSVYPSVKTVAAESELSERTVQYVLRQFVEEGLLIVVKVGGGGGHGLQATTEYRIDLNRLAKYPPSKETGVTNRGAKSAPPNLDDFSTGVQPDAARGATDGGSGCIPCTRSIQDNPSLNPSAQATPARSSRRDFDGSARKRATPAHVQKYVSEDALDKLRTIAPNWDRQWLLAKFLEWPSSKSANNMDAAFLGWAKTFTKGKSA